MRVWGRTVVSLRGNVNISKEIANAFKFKPCFGIHDVDASLGQDDVETHQQPLQRMVSKMCTGWSGEEYTKNCAPDYYHVSQMQFFGQAVCSSCREVCGPKSTVIPDKENMLRPLGVIGEEGGANIEKSHDDVQVLIPIRKSVRKRTKSHKLQDQDVEELKSRTEIKRETDLEEVMELGCIGDAHDDENVPIPPLTNSRILDEYKAFKEYAEKHVEIGDSGVKKCLLCGEMLSETSYVYLRHHFLDRHCADFRCPLCQQINLFKSENSLREHLSAYHKDTKLTSAEIRECHVTGENDEDQSDTKIEVEEEMPLIHDDQSNISGTEDTSGTGGFCEDCGKSFAKLTQHKRRVHLKEKNAICKECGAAFLHEWGLRRHMEKHKVQEGKDAHLGKVYKAKQIKISFDEYLQPGKLAVVKKEGSDNFVVCSDKEADIENEYRGNKPPMKDMDFLKSVFPEKHCSFCDSQFKQMYYLSLHLKLKHAFDWYQCSSCKVWRNTPTQMASHCEEVHGDIDMEIMCPCCNASVDVKEIEKHSLKCFLFKYKRPIRTDALGASFKCRLCLKVMPSRSTYEKHLRSSHANELFRCSYSGCSYVTIYDIQRINDHMAKHEKHAGGSTSSNDPIICDICGRSFPVRGQLLNHQIKEHGAMPEGQAKYLCPECDEVFVSKIEQERHLNVVHLKVSYGCEKCDKTFSDPRALKQHEVKVHNKDMLRVQCHICAEWLSCREHLENHNRSEHTGERPFPCTFCDEAFASLTKMGTHRSKNHPDSWREEKKRRQCPLEYKGQCHLCDQTRGTVDELRAHWNADHPGQTDTTHVPNMDKSKLAGKRVCDICGDSFDTKFGLRLHYRAMHLESKEERVTCEFCGRDFDSKGLRLHIALVHEDRAGKIASFKCTVCGENFLTQEKLYIHKQLVHQIELPPSMRKNHVCDICGKNGLSSIKLRRHMKTHEANRPKNCTYCDKEFETYAAMTRHRKMSHPEEWDRDKEKLFVEEGARNARASQRNYKKKWYYKNKARVRELERERARARRTGEKYVIPPWQNNVS